MKLPDFDWTNIKGAIIDIPQWARTAIFAVVIAGCFFLFWLFSAPSIDDFGAPDYFDGTPANLTSDQPSFLATVQVLYTENARLPSAAEETPGAVDTAVAATFQSMAADSTATQNAKASERAEEIRAGVETSFASTLSSMATQAAETQQAPRRRGDTPSP